MLSKGSFVGIIVYEFEGNDISVRDLYSAIHYKFLQLRLICRHRYIIAYETVAAYCASKREWRTNLLNGFPFKHYSQSNWLITVTAKVKADQQ
jgi:hypothetical protein